MGGQAARSPHRKGSKLLQKGGAHSCRPAPQGAAQGFLKPQGCLCRGLWENPAQMRWERGNEPLSGPKKQRQGIQALRNAKTTHLRAPTSRKQITPSFPGTGNRLLTEQTEHAASELTHGGCGKPGPFYASAA